MSNLYKITEISGRNGVWIKAVGLECSRSLQLHSTYSSSLPYQYYKRRVAVEVGREWGKILAPPHLLFVFN